MIVIEPPQSPGTPRRNAIRRRELTGFLALAMEAVGLRGAVSVLLTDDARIRQLNRTYRRKDKATDVLSFPSAGLGAPDSDQLAGDLAVSLETAARQAEAFGHPLELEVKILLLHGLLHLAGLDHETDTGQMARRENRLRKQFDLPSGLIRRSVSKPPKRTLKAVPTPLKKRTSSAFKGHGSSRGNSNSRVGGTLVPEGGTTPKPKPYSMTPAKRRSTP